MIKVKQIHQRDEIPVDEAFVLVIYGNEITHTTEGKGQVFTVPRGASDLSYMSVVHTAKEEAKRVNLPFVYACR